MKEELSEARAGVRETLKGDDAAGPRLLLAHGNSRRRREQMNADEKIGGRLKSGDKTIVDGAVIAATITRMGLNGIEWL